jgi:hypothetical protein
MLNSEDIASKAQGISAAELLAKLESKNISQSTKLILVGLMICAIMNQMKLSDFAALFDKIFPQPVPGDRRKDDLREQTKLFVETYRIDEIKGTTLKEFPTKLKLSKSNANKKIRALWQHLGLENREQLMFVAGWTRIISPNLECLKIEEKMSNLHQT